MAPVSILDRDFEQKIESLPHDEARASLMEHALRAQINERVAENPALYERLSAALARIIGELRAKVIDAAEGCKRMAVLREQVTKEEMFAADHGLSSRCPTRCTACWIASAVEASRPQRLLTHSIGARGVPTRRH